MKFYNILIMIAITFFSVPCSNAQIKIPTKEQLFFLLPGAIVTALGLAGAYHFSAQKNHPV